MKKLLILILSVMLTFLSCSSQKTINVNSIDEILTSIENYREEMRIQSNKQLNPKIPYVKYTGTFIIEYEDFNKLSEALKDSENFIHVSLDFSECNMNKDSYTILPYDSFIDVDSLIEFYLPEGLTYIGKSLSKCDNLKAVYFPKNTVVNETDEDAFMDNPALEKIVTSERSYTYEEWQDWRNSLIPKKNNIKEITASSELDKESGKYSINNIWNSYWTSWVEGNEGDGSGEKITITLKEPSTIEFICIKSGFGNLNYYWANNRPEYIAVALDDEDEEIYYLEDNPFAQEIPINKRQKLYSKITLTIKSVYKGTDGADDCAIDEINVNQAFSDYVYAPIVQKMARELYKLDVGEENIREGENGSIEVYVYDWPMDESYWTEAPYFSGHLYTGYHVGTGAGHREDLFNICLNPSGNHFLFIWRDEYDGINKIISPNVRIYAWMNNTWKEQTLTAHLSPLSDILKAINKLEKENLPYNFYIDSSDIVIIDVYSSEDAEEILYSLIFKYKNGIFIPEEE